MFLWRELYQDVGESYNLPLKHSETMLFCIYCKPITIFNLPKAKEKTGEGKRGTTEGKKAKSKKAKGKKSNT